MNRILLIDDDEALSELLCEYLQSEGFSCTPAYTGPDGLEKAQGDFDLIILDIMLPGMTGIDVLKALRQKGQQTPILMLTAKGDDLDRILGLELGADDYVPKPCHPRELLARVKAILRRAKPSAPTQSELEINSGRMEAKFRGQSLRLTGAEFKTLEALYMATGEIVSKGQLCELALGRKLTRYDRSVDVHVSNLRKKLIEMGADADIIVNQRGTGYMLKSDQPA